MLLSTSSSEARAPGQRAGKRDIAVALAILLTIGLIFELGSRYGVTRFSKITARVRAEYEAARTIKRTTKGQVLLLGNSLLDAGVQMPRLKQALAPDWEITRLMIEQTTYLDWYYGARRLFDEGMRPDVVALCLSARHLVDSSVRGEYFAQHLLEARDLPDAAQRLGLHPTEAANMLFANLSHFYGMRSEIRKVLMGRLMPGTRSLMALIAPAAVQPLEDNQVWNTAVTRLREYRDLTSTYGARFVFILPPLPGDDKSAIVARAGAESGVPVITIPLGSLSQQHFRDGHHLAESGAAIYTTKLIPKLTKVVTGTSSRHSGSN
jgi:hypothetical protein